MISPDALKSTIRLLEDARIRYFVFGGVALDGVRGMMTREHGDIDLYVASGDLEKFCSVMAGAGHVCTKRENMYFIEQDDFKLGIVPLSEGEDTCTSWGNKTLAHYPRQAFAQELRGAFAGISFAVAPYEVLAFESQFSRFPLDVAFGASLPCNRNLLAQVRSEFIRPSRKVDS